MTFAHPGDSHQHSLETLNQLFEYDDFMFSLRTMVDLGCGTGDDLIWWATRTTRDDNPKPLNIDCYGVDLDENLLIASEYKNITYQPGNFEDAIVAPDGGFDVLWCHDAFQYAQNPIQTLSNWWHIASSGGMLSLTVPITQQIHHRQLSYTLPNGCYYHHTMVSLMYMLATAGWDCGAGFFKQLPTEPWLHAVVYKSIHPPLDPRKTDWHRLSELNLLPPSAAASVYAHSALRQQDLIVPWLDHSLLSMAV
jgi:ubiquinone/menaquinone biosynthesis C-methylase UbiE